MAGSALPDARLEHLAAYLVELALCEYGALQFLPSCIAAAAVLVAQFSLGVRVWSPTLEHYTRYGPQDLQASTGTICDDEFIAACSFTTCMSSSRHGANIPLQVGHRCSMAYRSARCFTPLQLPARMLHHLAVEAYRQEVPPASREKFSSSRCSSQMVAVAR